MVNMIRIKLCTLVVLFTINLSVSKANDSTNKQVLNIKKLYKEAKDLENKSHFHHDIIMNKMLPAVGHSQTKIRFVFLNKQVNPEKDPYLMTHSLKKIIVDYNIAASSKHHFEYLYNLQGIPIFAYYRIRSINGNFEYRYYYKNKKLIMVKAIESPNTDNNSSGKYALRQTKSNFNKTDKKKAAHILSKAINYANYFKTILELEELK